jgi:hypothetical protein
LVDYNPHQDYIIGQEWVPIREVSLQFGENINSFEQGHGFTLTQSTQLNSARFYVHERPKGIYYNQAYTINVYPQSTYADAGPVRRVIIPVNGGSVTGSGWSILTPDTTVAQALSDPTKYARGIVMDIGNSAAGEAQAFFGVNQYAQLLYNKRILGVNILANWRTSTTPDIEADPGYLTFTITAGTTDSFVFAPPAASAYPPQGTRIYTRYRIGDVAIWHGNTRATTDVIPWTYTELQKFESTNANPIHLEWSSLAEANQGQTIYWNYCAMEVLFCEETRVAFGTKIFNRQPLGVSTSFEIDYTLGANPVVMKDLAGSANPVLAAGDYYVTLSEASMGDNRDAVANGNPTASINALREYYPIPSLPATRILLPYPLDESIVDTEALTAEYVDVLPQLSLHASGSAAAFTQVHPYGRQAVGQVWGSQYVEQDLDLTAVTAGTYPFIRFIARRWGNTTQALVVTDQFSGIGTNISVADFDALDEIVDGWKQVDVEFSVAPAFGGGSGGPIRWTSTGETAGNRWEILGAASPALSGVPGNLLNLAPSASQLYLPTYQPPLGSTYDMTWMPQGVSSPYVSGASDDDSSDAFVILSLEPPEVTDFAVVEGSQAVTGIGQDCDLDPCGIPTDILYAQLSWTSISALPASGFGAYEIQRMDPHTDWATIMLTTDVAATGFIDYELRVGIETTYRIRSLNVYDFVGPWSDEITITLTSPGVTGSCLDDAHVLIFTSNVSQEGEYNLAYSSVWEGTVAEDFALPEAGFTQMQAMYDRDYFVAFRPDERGGEVFSRTVLVQAAAISPLTLPGFTALSDMAWADIPYVCVRDEDGNRWFANVSVPNGRVQLYRSIYMATITMTEVTDTPTPVDTA